MDEKPPFNFAHWIQDRLFRALIWGLLRLPYEWRVPLCGWVVSRIISPLAGYDRRIRENLALIYPELPAAEVKRIIRAVPDNVGRSLIEMYSGPEFVARAAALPIEGKGIEALDAAHKAGRPTVLVTAHFGNYDASRAALIARGYEIGGLYMNMTNASFNEHYVSAMAAIGTPLFPRGRQGMAGMVRFLRGGGMLGMVIDQHMRSGKPLRFMGHEALTALSAAELAIKYNALLVPAYAVRQEDGLSFQIIVEEPIAHSDAETMTQALNDSLERLVDQHITQWFWIHRRWKGAGRKLED